MVGMSAYPVVVTSPATCTWPVVISVSTATRLSGSSLSRASRTESLIWSAILSGWPSVTDSDVNRRRDTELLPARRGVARVYRGAPTAALTQSGGHMAHGAVCPASRPAPLLREQCRNA